MRTKLQPHCRHKGTARPGTLSIRIVDASGRERIVTYPDWREEFCRLWMRDNPGDIAEPINPPAQRKGGAE